MLRAASLSCLLSLLALACEGGGATPSKAVAQPSPVAAAPAKDGAKAAAPVEDAKLPKLPAGPVPRVAIPADMPPIPPLSSQPASEAAAAERETLASRALALHKEGDHLGEATQLRAALEVDPSHLESRYALARAYAKQGKVTWAMIILQQFSDDPSLAAAERLLMAKRDPELSPLHVHLLFNHLTAAEAKLPNTDAAGAQVEAWVQAWASDAKAELPAVFDARLELGLVVEDWAAGEDSKAADAKLSKTMLPNLATLDARITTHRGETANHGFRFGPKRTCARRCCSWEEEEGAMKPGQLYLSKVCFKLAGEGVLYATRLVLAKS